MAGTPAIQLRIQIQSWTKPTSDRIATRGMGNAAREPFRVAQQQPMILNSIPNEVPMISVQNTQSLTDFRQKASETIDRINRTGDAEIITVNGEARAVLVAPAVFDEISREFELASVQRALNQFEQGKGRTIDEFFDELRGKLLSMKTSKRKSPKGKAAK